MQNVTFQTDRPVSLANAEKIKKNIKRFSTDWLIPHAERHSWRICYVYISLNTRPCYAKSSYRSVDPQTLHGNVHEVDHMPNGPTSSAAITTMFPLRLCGGKLLVAVTRERRYGPSRLRVNDDDDDDDTLA